MAILVTGGAGYIGSHTAVELLEKGYEIVILDNLSNASSNAIERIESLAKQKVKFYKADIRDRAALEDIFAKADAAGEAPFIVVLDGIEDPHNLGAILRSAECAGAHGVIIAKRNACGLTDTVAKSSAGAIEYVPCAKVTNIARTLDELKDRGIWIYACDMDGETFYKQEMTGPCAIVIGAEGKGISRLVKEKCDFTVSMPLKGKIQSLNASNAACVLMYEIRRQRDEQ